MTESETNLPARRDLWGPIAWYVAAVLLPIGLSYPSSYDPKVEPRKAAWEYLSTYYQLSFMLLPIALLAMIVGVLTLHGHIAPEQERKPSVWDDGSLFSILALALLLPTVAIRGLALPEYAQTYVLTDQESLRWFSLDSFGRGGWFLTGLALYSMIAGAFRLPLSTPGAPLLPPPAATLFKIGLLLMSFELSGSPPSRVVLGYGLAAQLVRLLLGVLLTAGCLAIGRALWRDEGPGVRG